MANPTFAPVTGVPVVSSVEWSSGLLHGGGDCGLWCTTCWCPCITFGRVAEIVDRGSTSCSTSAALYGLLCHLGGFQWIYSSMYRGKLRAQYGITGGPCGDCCVHFFCERCALRQEYRELVARGYDPMLGWDLNVQRAAAAAATTAPAMHQQMMR
ncbi:hypothetical protein GUJ93_ZPchr0013g37427 [Zizania palustris]|uniref:Uncharacterized protein n=1 Tax=Zizania palustris TaxID=103762 RepID=A0A8J5WZG4_ZIZPA|nr:hypothetical protein GUJ93_ZPchr0013g37427 [Zizania palustris]